MKQQALMAALALGATAAPVQGHRLAVTRSMCRVLLRLLRSLNRPRGRSKRRHANHNTIPTLARPD